MILPIYAFGERVLRAECEEINRNFPHLEKIIKDMWETMYHSHGVGLAAPQVGLNIRLFIIDSREMYEEEDQEKGMQKVFINPSILSEEGKLWSYEEGCLSIPGIREDVQRKETLRIKYFDENFEPQIETFDGLNARVIQHEYDHIEGILFIDHISPLKKQLIKNRLLQITRGLVDVKYKMKFPRR